MNGYKIIPYFPSLKLRKFFTRSLFYAINGWNKIWVSLELRGEPDILCYTPRA